METTAFYFLYFSFNVTSAIYVHCSMSIMRHHIVHYVSQSRQFVSNAALGFRPTESRIAFFPYLFENGIFGGQNRSSGNEPTISQRTLTHVSRRGPFHKETGRITNLIGTLPLHVTYLREGVSFKVEDKTLTGPNLSHYDPYGVDPPYPA